MGDSELPPTYYFSGITFNPDFYQSSSSDYLTATTGKKIFLTFPYAQGSESIAQLYSSNIDSLTPTSTFNFLDTQTAGINIGDSVTGTITVGSTSSVTNINGVGTIYANKFDTLSATTDTTFLDSITSGKIDIAKYQVGGVFKLANGARTASIAIGNNATAGTLTLGAIANANTRILGGTISIGYSQTTNTIDIGNEQTTGDINIGVSAGRLAGGTINICSTNTSGGAIVPITIGNSTSTTAMNGTCTFAKQISTTLGITSAGNITTSGSATITALSGGSLIGPYKNAVAPNASITTAGVITGTSLVLGTGAITSCGAITSSGLITANGGLTIGGANGITLTSSAYTPTAGQLGYVITGAMIASFTAATSGNTTSVSSISLTTGTWIVCAGRQFVAQSGTTAAWFGLGKTLKNNSAFATGDVEYGVQSTILTNTIGVYTNITGIVVLTTPTTIYLNYNPTYTGTQPTIGGTFPLMNATRIG